MQINQLERAYRAWPLLVGRAQTGDEEFTYGELGRHLDVHHRAVRFVLAVIQEECIRKGWPPLTLLVVNQATRKPGLGFIAWNGQTRDQLLREVRTWNWDPENPFAYAKDGTSEDGLVDEILKGSSSGLEVYEKIGENRGAFQYLFRKALLKAYQRRCAFCRFSQTEALEAAHILPWSLADQKERVDMRNGILLCATHHALFDASILEIDGNHTIRVKLSRQQKDSEDDEHMLFSLEGKPMCLPKEEGHRPGVDYLDRRAQR